MPVQQSVRGQETPLQLFLCLKFSAKNAELSFTGKVPSDIKDSF